MKMRALLMVVTLLFAACSSWGGPAEVQLKDGTIFNCPKGLKFDQNGVSCVGNGVYVTWEHVAGYRTK